MAEISFNRILTLLRKERGITQKQAAESLGVSQALLSHYEKGIRECGLDFVVRAADFYGVSCDYLLGRSPDRTGLTLTVDELPDEADSNDKRYSGSVLATLNKKLLTNSENILFNILQRAGDTELVTEVSSYLMSSVYKMFRLVYGANPKNQDALFRVKRSVYAGYADALMSRCEANASALLCGDRPKDSAVDGAPAVPLITTQSMSADYPQYATSLLNLIQHTEKKIDNR